MKSGPTLAQTTPMRDYLVCYDYGAGGLWWWIEAPDAASIHAVFAGLIVFEQPPTWWTDEADRATRRVCLSDVNDEVLIQLRR